MRPVHFVILAAALAAAPQVAHSQRPEPFRSSPSAPFPLWAPDSSFRFWEPSRGTARFWEPSAEAQRFWEPSEGAPRFWAPPQDPADSRPPTDDFRFFGPTGDFWAPFGELPRQFWRPEGEVPAPFVWRRRGEWI